MSEGMSEIECQGLRELEAACDESIRYGGTGWTRTAQLCGTKEVRSSRTMLALVARGYAEKKRFGIHPQAQYSWRITDEGRAALHSDRVTG